MELDHGQARVGQFYLPSLSESAILLRMGQNFVSLESELAAFTFLDTQNVLLGCINFPTVPATGVPHTVSLLVVDFVKSSSERIDIHDIEYQCALLFPEMQAEIAPDMVYIRAGSSTSRNMAGFPHDRVPFRTSHEDRLLVISVWLGLVNHVGPLQLFVPAQTILSLLTSETCAGGNKTLIPWEAWGPSGTRLLIASEDYSAVWVCNVAGCKFATVREHDIVAGTRYAIVYDFNQPALRRAIAEGNSEYSDPTNGVRSVCVTKPNTLSQRLIFKDEVVTSLPYRSTVKRIEVGTDRRHAVAAVMMTEDALVTVHPVRPFTLHGPSSSFIDRLFLRNAC